MSEISPKIYLASGQVFRNFGLCQIRRKWRFRSFFVRCIVTHIRNNICAYCNKAEKTDAIRD